MLINLYNARQILLRTVKFDERECSDIVFGLNFPKEITFCKIVNSSNDIEYSSLNYLYNQLKDLEYKDIKIIELVFNQKQKFTFESTVKSIFYRTMLYSSQGQLEFKLYLTLRFEEEHPIIYNKEEQILKCDKNCEQLNKKIHRCEFFHSDLNDINEICTECFLQERDNQIKELVNYDRDIINALEDKYGNRQN